MFVSPGVDVYKGQIVGIHQRPGDLSLNVCKKKAATNIRSNKDQTGQKHLQYFTYLFPSLLLKKEIQLLMFTFTFSFLVFFFAWKFGSCRLTENKMLGIRFFLFWLCYSYAVDVNIFDLT